MDMDDKRVRVETGLKVRSRAYNIFSVLISSLSSDEPNFFPFSTTSALAENRQVTRTYKE